MKLKKFYLKLLKVYKQSWVYRSPFLTALFLSDRACRFEPSCSEYTYQAIDRYGIIRGSLKGLERISRCHPWSKGGYDPLR